MSAVYLAADEGPPVLRRRRQPAPSALTDRDAHASRRRSITPGRADHAAHRRRSVAGAHGRQGRMSACTSSCFPRTRPVRHVHDGMGRRAVAIVTRCLKAVEDARQQRRHRQPARPGRTHRAFADGVDPGRVRRVLTWPTCAASAAFTVANGRSARSPCNDLRAEPRCDRCWKRDGTVSGVHL